MVRPEQRPGSGDGSGTCRLTLINLIVSRLNCTVYDEPPSSVFLGLPVQSFAALGRCRAEAIVVCCYDVRAPMRKGFLPPTVTRRARLHWIFGPGTEGEWAEPGDHQSV